VAGAWRSPIVLAAQMRLQSFGRAGEGVRQVLLEWSDGKDNWVYVDEYS